MSTSPSIGSRTGDVIWGHWDTTEQPTEPQKRDIDMAQSDVDKYLKDAAGFFNDMASYELAIKKAGVPYTPGGRWRSNNALNH